MLKVNVGMSRKVSRDYNSTGFSINLEGELSVPLDDPQAVIEKIKEFYDVAEETLAQQIERHESESAISQRDERPKSPIHDQPTHGTSRTATTPAVEPSGNNGSQNGNHQTTNGSNGQADQATNKQIQFLLNLGKRQSLNPKQVEQRIEEILGRQVGIYQLSKRDAAQVIDALNINGAVAGNGTQRAGR